MPLPEAVGEVCPACGVENTGEARACAQCGLPVSTRKEGELPPAPPEAPSLPPRDLKGLIRESFRVYRRQFASLVILAFIPQVPALISLAVPEWLALIFSVAGILIAFVVLGAAFRLVALDYLGQEVDPFKCFGGALGRAAPLIFVGILFSLALIASLVLALILVGIPLFFYLMVSLFFAEGSVMMEGKGAVDALERSWHLVKGSWWRVFGIGVAFVLVTIVLWIPALIFSGLAVLINDTAGGVVALICGALISPVSMVGTALVYFDLRARKEGYSLERMAAEVES